MDLVSFSKPIKWLTIIPVITGLLNFIEIVLPTKSIDTKVVSKKSTYRIKTASTTYTVNFQGINDQFTEEIYNALSEGDEVRLKVTPLNKQILEIAKTSSNIRFENSTGESWALYSISLLFLLTGLAWLKIGQLKPLGIKFLGVMIIMSLVSLIRIIVNL